MTPSISTTSTKT
ncbi:hypothetical protein MTR67_043903 [Solanum verrucosum]|uniref:Uncharacterized protein n=1 Tax=Solanum verrucosum TaxID=315347 RepID=A0AAF0USA8_SOLVR|nr:hypothetical protein MTR67_043903 [Solanum verrucosum]